ALPIFTALGGYGMSVVTALTAQNTREVLGVCEIPAEFVGLQFDAVASAIGIDAAKTGMLVNVPIIEMVSRKIRQYRIEKVIVDPVLAATTGTALLADEARDVLLKELFPLAWVVTPNIPEAESLTGLHIESVKDMEEAARAIGKFGPRYVVVKGGHLADASDEAVDVLFDGVGCRRFSGPRLMAKQVHGTGCVFSAAVATFLAAGGDVISAVARAKEYLTAAIRNAQPSGAGFIPGQSFFPSPREKTG
ncbi:MAG: bifunctional hydroxymethylpyrimidine kinase/phosphomethylpyrimidine kinase, partial [Smithellaceae bacterium]|nr:bifunctional hydroxymethylpyrimidine kinase/phosphomethylpyrimidine kinase [Smithellaceae bacterium]